MLNAQQFETDIFFGFLILSLTAFVVLGFYYAYIVIRDDKKVG